MGAAIRSKLGQADTLCSKKFCSQKKRILIVDDEAPIRMATRTCLELSGLWEVLDAASGLEGLEMAQAEQPDAILLDIVMPEMDGFVFLQNLRSHPFTHAIPVILFTATARLIDPERIHRLNVIGVITKPFNPLYLANEILELLRSS